MPVHLATVEGKLEVAIVGNSEGTNVKILGKQPQFLPTDNRGAR
jgi:hypothetical protein